MLWIWFAQMIDNDWRIETWKRDGLVILSADRGREHRTFKAPSVGEAVGKFKNWHDEWRRGHEKQD